ncbi:MAG: FkbM family methyltransferase [Alphaproteobacteria bacterium]|nr:FkbM family methyltransferase [Alphaproteobacteria bacterium]
MTEPFLSFHLLAQAVLRQSGDKRPFFLEIGAMDGVQYDVMYPHAKTGAWDGVLAEPMPDMFAALKKNYEGVAGLRFANCAIDSGNGTLKMTRADAELIRQGIFPPEYMGMTTSLRREAFFQRGKLTKEQEALVEKGLVDVEVPCCTLSRLIEDFGISKIDLLIIDTEGSDWQIAQQLDLTLFRPRLICLEYAHFSEQDKHACTAHFEAHGYSHATCAAENLNRLFYDKSLME